MKKRNFLILLLCISSFSLIRCKEDTPAIEYKQQGSIKGTVSGTSYDNETEFTESFSFSRYAPSQVEFYPGFETYEDGGIYLYGYRYDVFTNSYLSVEIYMDDENADPELYDFEFWFYKETKEIFVFGMDDENDISVTNYSFDLETGRLKFNIEVEGTDNTTGNNASLEATVDIVLKRWIY